MTWVYIKSEPQLFTVGFYKPDGRWEPDSDFERREEAARRVHYLNGGRVDTDVDGGWDSYSTTHVQPLHQKPRGMK